MIDEVSSKGKEVKSKAKIASNPPPLKKSVKAKAKTKRRTVRSVMRSVYPNAPTELLEIMENWLGASNLNDLKNLDGAAESQMNAAFNRYVNRIGSGQVELPKAFETKLRNYASERKLNFESMMGGRGLAELNNAVRAVIGYNGIDAIVKKASS